MSRFDGRTRRSRSSICLAPTSTMTSSCSSSFTLPHGFSVPPGGVLRMRAEYNRSNSSSCALALSGSSSARRSSRLITSEVGSSRSASLREGREARPPSTPSRFRVASCSTTGPRVSGRPRSFPGGPELDNTRGPKRRSPSRASQWDLGCRPGSRSLPPASTLPGWVGIAIPLTCSLQCGRACRRSGRSAPRCPSRRSTAARPGSAPRAGAHRCSC